VFQIHGPDIAVKQAGGVWHQVVPRAPPLFAFIIWDGNKVTLVQHIDQRSIGVKQEALHNKDLSLLLLRVGLWNDLGIQGVINAMRLLKLYWVLQPCVDGAHHGVHVQSSNDLKKSS